MNKITEQSQAIKENKQDTCKLTKDNLHLKSRVAELEGKLFPKDDSYCNY